MGSVEEHWTNADLKTLMSLPEGPADTGSLFYGPLLLQRGFSVIVFGFYLTFRK